MERIHLQTCHLVEQFFHRLGTLKMAAFILHVGSPREGRFVRNDARRYRHSLRADTRQLTQRLQCIQQSETGISLCHNLLSTISGSLYVQSVSFVIPERRHIVQLKNDSRFFRLGDIDRLESCFGQHFGYILLIQSGFRIEIDCGLATQYDLILKFGNLFRFGQYLNGILLGLYSSHN